MKYIQFLVLSLTHIFTSLIDPHLYQDYAFTSFYMGPPVSPGTATAPYEYQRGSKKSKEALIAFNKTGQPLSIWADTSRSTIAFNGWEKKGFNRGNRIEDLRWTYGGGHTMTMCMNLKDMQPTEYDGSIPLYMDKKIPIDDTIMQPFDIVKISIMPKNDDGLKKPKKSCFTLKSMGSTMRTYSGLLSHFKETMHKSKEAAEEDTLLLIRGEGKYKSEARGSNNLLPYAHQVLDLPCTVFSPIHVANFHYRSNACPPRRIRKTTPAPR